MKLLKKIEVWTLAIWTNEPHLLDREDKAARSWQDDALQLRKKFRIQTYIKVNYSGFILYKYIRELSRVFLLDSTATVLEEGWAPTANTCVDPAVTKLLDTPRDGSTKVARSSQKPPQYQFWVNRKTNLFLHFQKGMLICLPGQHLLLHFMEKCGSVSQRYLWEHQSSYGHYTTIQKEVASE